MLKRNAQQVRLCQKVYKLASELEKQKVIEEKKSLVEDKKGKNKMKKQILDSFENYYRDRINLLKEKMNDERQKQNIMEQANSKELAKMKMDLKKAKRSEIDQYCNLLEQEDARYDFESTNLEKLEDEIVKIYKRK
jgi:hypothetical protein